MIEAVETEHDDQPGKQPDADADAKAAHGMVQPAIEPLPPLCEGQQAARPRLPRRTAGGLTGFRATFRRWLAAAAFRRLFRCGRACGWRLSAASRSCPLRCFRHEIDSYQRGCESRRNLILVLVISEAVDQPQELRLHHGNGDAATETSQPQERRQTDHAEALGDQRPTGQPDQHEARR